MISASALRDNPALLKLDLYCKGLRLDDSAYVEEDGGRKILRTRAGLGSGLELILPGGLWTNVPVTEPFAARSPYPLHRLEGAYSLRREGAFVAPVRLSPRPAWYERATASAKPMTRIGTLQGTYLGIYQAKVCEYWTAKPTRVNCKFCSVGLNLGVDDSDEKSVDEVMEVVRAARDESGISYVDFNTGHYEGDTYLDIRWAPSPRSACSGRSWVRTSPTPIRRRRKPSSPCSVVSTKPAWRRGFPSAAPPTST